MPSRLAALKLHVGKESNRSRTPSSRQILPGVGFIQDAGNKTALQRSDTLLSTTSSATAVSTTTNSKGPEKVVLQLAAGAELPSVPYKLRFALSSQEWDERMECIARHREESARPYWEMLWFFLVLAIPAAAVYPLYMTLSTSITGANKQDPTTMAGLITIGVVTLLAMLLATPLFVRKYVLQRRMHDDADRWAEIDCRKSDKPGVRWRVRLPGIFRTACDIHIPVPPRKRSISLEAVLEKARVASLAPADEKGGVALSRFGSIASQRSMFED